MEVSIPGYLKNTELVRVSASYLAPGMAQARRSAGTMSRSGCYNRLSANLKNFHVFSFIRHNFRSPASVLCGVLLALLAVISCGGNRGASSVVDPLTLTHRVWISNQLVSTGLAAGLVQLMDADKDRLVSAVSTTGSPGTM